jgi:hypothetical protein
MNDIPNIEGLQTPKPLESRSERRSKAPIHDRPNPAGGNGDRVELSELARMVAAARDLPDIRVDRIVEVRKQIEAGTYETPEKIEVTVSRLLQGFV